MGVYTTADEKIAEAKEKMSEAYKALLIVLSAKSNIMKKLKQYIDYLFWKRTWFRAVFILFPTIPFLVTLLISNNGYQSKAVLDTGLIFYIIVFAIAMADNDDVDNHPNPFKK